jgi:hypothetical protein
MLKGADAALLLSDNSGENYYFNHGKYVPYFPLINFFENQYKDFEYVNDKRIWEVIPKENIPEGRRCVKSNWIFKIMYYLESS